VIIALAFDSNWYVVDYILFSCVFKPAAIVWCISINAKLINICVNIQCAEYI